MDEKPITAFKETKTMWNLIVFGVIGLFAGASSRLLYPGRQSMHILGTMALGMGGAILGGILSWIWWPAVNGQFQTGNLSVSFLGAILAIVLWAGVAYKRSLMGYRKPPQ